jgi:hypothetical protein
VAGLEGLSMNQSVRTIASAVAIGALALAGCEFALSVANDS